MPTRRQADRSRFTFRRLSTSERANVEAFASGDADLDDFLRSDADRYQAHHMAETYLEFYEGALVGFAAVMTDAVILNTGERRKLRTPNTIPLAHDDHPVVPAVKIARLAVADSFRKEYSGGGQELVRFAGWLAFRASELVACRLLTVDAYPDAVAFYERIGFVHNRAKEYRERSLASMRVDLFSPEIQGWLFE